MNRNAQPATNPFATRHVKPGANPYLFPPGESVETLLAKLAANGWRGEIIGPHGSGKSTLLAALVDAVEKRGRTVVVYRLHEGDRRLPAIPANIRTLPAGVLAVIDGYEQLPLWRKWVLRILCKRRRLGLLVTAHAATGLPLVWQTSVDLQTFGSVVDQLLAAEPRITTTITREDIARAHAAHPTNLREALFALYDIVEARRAPQP
jgi:ABC-type cobalamin/Fe3+-siderophores transport system ATPase subunit